MPINIIEALPTALLKYTSKEGVKAAAVKGITPIFKVTSISFIPQSKDAREESIYGHVSDAGNETSFAAVLEKAAEKEATASLNCHTATYGMNCKMNYFLYQPKEYTY